MSEFDVEGVEVDGRVGGHSVEGQDAGRTVHIHSHSVRDGGGRERDECLCVVVPHRVKVIGAAQTPGLVVPSEPAGLLVAFPSDSSESHRDIHLSVPLHLPVTATAQTISAQQLTEDVESVGLVGIRLLLVHQLHLPVAVGQPEVPVCGDRVECEVTGNWWRKEQRNSLSSNTTDVFCHGSCVVSSGITSGCSACVCAAEPNRVQTYISSDQELASVLHCCLPWERKYSWTNVFFFIE